MKRTMLALALMIAVCTGMPAQDTAATISGRVVDSSGAVLPGAQVVIVNEDTGITRTTATDDAGRYSAPALTLGNYKVTASREGFQSAARSGITLTLGRQAIVNFDLQVGAVSQVLEVTGEAPLVDTVKGSVGQLVESATIQELPLNGRDLTQLITLQTGAVEYSAYGEQGGRGSTGGKLISVSGGRLTTNVFLMDGIIIESSNSKTPTGVSGNFLGVEGIREFKVESNAYSAEFGRGAGGIFNLVTKSGTNQFHGSLFEYLRNDNFDAKKWETNAFGATDANGDAIKPEFKRNQYGGSFAGPIKRDKTFFFGLYEGFRERQGRTISDTRTFTDAVRNNALPGVTINPLVVPYLRLWPSPNAEPISSEIAKYVFTFSQPVNEDFYQIRADHHFSESDSIFFRYSFSDSNDHRVSSFPDFSTTFDNTNHFSTLEETHIFSPVLLATFRVGVSRTNPLELSQNPDIDSALLFNPSVPQLGGISITNGPSSIGNGTTGGGLTSNSFQYVVDARYIKGAHSTKFGFNWNTIQFFGWLPGRDAGDYTFGSLNAFYTASPNRFRGTISEGFNDSYRSMSQEINGLYFQDDFQVTPRLTLNLGLRYEFIRVPRERYDRIGNFRGDRNFILGATVNDITKGDPWIENPSKKNFAPRLGFAYDLFGDQKTALRGGWGIFHLQFSHTWWRTSVFRMPPFLVESQASGNVPFPSIFQLCGNLNPFAPGSACASRPAPDFPQHKFSTPYAMQYNLTLQRQLNSNTTISLGYVGSRGVRLPAVADINIATVDNSTGRAVFPSGTPVSRRPNPNFDDMRMRYAGVDSFYNSMQLSYQRRLDRGWQYGFSYTWSRNIDDISGNQTASDTNTGVNWITYYPDKSMYRGLSSFDIRHVFSFNSVYELPFGRGKAIGSNMPPLADVIVGGWQFGGIMNLAGGVPATVDSAPSPGMTGSGVRQQFPDLLAGTNNNPTSGTSAGCTQRNPLNPTQVIRTIAPGTPLGTPEMYFDPCAFVAPPAATLTTVTLGNLGRNTLILPGRATVDFTLSKNYTIQEEMKLQFRVEAYNFFNHPNFGIPVVNSFDASNRPNPEAGRILSTSTSARQVQFGLKLMF